MQRFALIGGFARMQSKKRMLDLKAAVRQGAKKIFWRPNLDYGLEAFCDRCSST
jgi:hypothetical protein